MWRYKPFILACILTMHGQYFFAQTPYSWQDFVEEMANDDYAEEQGWTDHMEEMAQLASHPMEINTATREQMQQLPFLSDEQIEEIHEYIFLNQGMRSMSELMAIPSIDQRTRKYLQLFFTANVWPDEWKDSVSLKSLLHNAHHDVSTRLDIPLYYRLGYSYPPSQGGYQGSTLYHNMRYQLTSQKHLEAGLAAEKDQGEPFRNNRGWDHYGGYLMLRDMGWLRSVVVGDYKMGFGEGLVVNTSFSTGKSSLMKRPSQGIRAKRSMDEANYFRGVALTLGSKVLNLSLWLSHRRLDATLSDEGDATTIVASGLHRTTAELDKKHNLGTTMAGGNLSWRNKGFHLGATGYFQRFHRKLSPGDALYRQIYPEGRNFGVMGVNYGYTHLWFAVAGETAYSTQRGGWATQNRVSWKITPNYRLSGSYRFYSYNYYSFHASALSENSRVQNESGATLRLDATPIDNLSVAAYIDFFYNPWPRYSLTHSSRGQEAMLQAECQIGEQNTLSARYQLKRKEQSDEMRLHNRLRLQYTRLQGPYWRLQSQLTLHSVDHDGVGWAVAERIRYKRQAGQLSALVAYFSTPNFETRLYQYEPMLSQMFRFPSLYGRGIRMVGTGLYRFWKNRLTVEVLYSLTRYTDREVQGSGMQLIDSPWKNDISLQLRLRL